MSLSPPPKFPSGSVGGLLLLGVERPGWSFEASLRWGLWLVGTCNTCGRQVYVVLPGVTTLDRLPLAWEKLQPYLEWHRCPVSDLDETEPTADEESFYVEG